MALGEILEELGLGWREKKKGSARSVAYVSVLGLIGLVGDESAGSLFPEIFGAIGEIRWWVLMREGLLACLIDWFCESTGTAERMLYELIAVVSRGFLFCNEFEEDNNADV